MQVLRTPQRGRYRWTLYVALTTMMLLCPVRGALGDEDVPSAISIDQFASYLDWLDPADDQTRAMMSFFRSYARAYEALGPEVEALARQRTAATELAELVPHVADRDRERNRLRARARRLDTNLFDAMNAILSDEQSQRLERVRAHRCRSCAGVDEFCSLTGRDWLDLSDLVDDEELFDGSDRATVREMMLEYERRLTGLVEPLGRSVRALPLEVLEALKDRGFSADFATAYPAVWLEKAGSSLAQAGRVDALNVRTVRAIRDSLSPDGQAVWAEMTLPRLYPDSWFIRRARRRLEDAAGTVRGTADDQAQLGAIIESASWRLDGLPLRELNERYDQIYETRRSPWQPGLGKQGEEYRAFVDQVQLEVDDIIVSTHQKCREALSPTAFRDWQQSILASRGGSSRTEKRARTHAVERACIPSAACLLGYLELDLPERYALAAVSKEWRTQLNSIAASLDASRRGKTILPPATLKEVAQADDAFFSKIRSVLGVDKPHNGRLRSTVDVLEHVRTRQLLSHNVPCEGASAVDIAEICARAELSQSEWVAVCEVLRAYDREASVLFRTRFDLARAYYPSADDRDLRQKFDDARRDIARFNMLSLERVCGAVGQESAERIRDLFQRIAFPQLVYDAAAVSGPLRAALELPGLSDDARSHLARIGEEYTEDYRRLMTDMVAASEDATWWWEDDDGRLWPGGTNDRVEKIRSLRMRRQELNSAAAAGLWAVLSHEQAEKVGLRAPR